MLVGLFDSGVGGLSILQEVERRLPNVSSVYLADTANFPYGTKTEEEVRDISVRAVERLLPYKPNAMVVACNTASTSALPHLREQFPDLPFVGVVPALKPATAISQTKKIAVLATARTLASTAYGELKRDFASGVTIVDQACPGWVELVEQGHLHDPEVDQAVRDVVEPLARHGVDTYVLGCTHYPFLHSLIQHYAGNMASVLDSGEAVARQLERVVPNIASGSPSRTILTTGSVEHLQRFLNRVMNWDTVVRAV